MVTSWWAQNKILIFSIFRNFFSRGFFEWCNQPVWPDWAIYWTLDNFLKPLATNNLPKSTTFFGNFCKCVKIYHFWATFTDIWQFFSGHTDQPHPHCTFLLKDFFSVSFFGFVVARLSKCEPLHVLYHLLESFNKAHQNLSIYLFFDYTQRACG